MQAATARAAGVDVQFLANFQSILAALQPWGALLIVVVSLVETVIGAQGKESFRVFFLPRH
jgi:hypothetical protein